MKSIFPFPPFQKGKWITKQIPCVNAVPCMYPLQGKVGTTPCLSAFSSQFSWTMAHSLRLQQLMQPGAPAHTLSSLSTLEQMVRNLLSGTPQTANIPSRMRRSLTWGKGRNYQELSTQADGSAGSCFTPCCFKHGREHSRCLSRVFWWFFLLLFVISVSHS